MQRTLRAFFEWSKVMAHSNYGGRNGVSSIVRLTRELCRIYTAYSGGIINYVNNSSMSPSDKATVIAWLNGGVAACAILEASVMVSYE